MRNPQRLPPILRRDVSGMNPGNAGEQRSGNRRQGRPLPQLARLLFAVAKLNMRRRTGTGPDNTPPVRTVQPLTPCFRGSRPGSLRLSMRQPSQHSMSAAPKPESLKRAALVDVPSTPAVPPQRRVRKRRNEVAGCPHFHSIRESRWRRSARRCSWRREVRTAVTPPARVLQVRGSETKGRSDRA